jgi:hypothetical protein
MDVERIIEDIEQLQEMFEAPDIRPLRNRHFCCKPEGMMTHWRTALGSASGRAMASVVVLRIRSSNCRERRANPREAGPENGEEENANVLPKLTDPEQDLLSHMQEGYQLETDSRRWRPDPTPTERQ